MAYYIPTIKVADVHEVLVENGDINIHSLQEYLHNHPNILVFTLFDREYGTTEDELMHLCIHWSKFLRG